MTANKNIVKAEKELPILRLSLFTSRLSLGMGLFLLALLPRAYDLQRFVTADETKWIYRSAQFLAALLRGDWPATSVNLTPAVTTTWLGSLGLALYYQLNRAMINVPLVDWLVSLPEFRTELGVLEAARWPMVILTSLGVVAFYLLAHRLFDPGLAFLAAALVALDPYPIALSRILGHDAPTAVFMSLSVLLLLLTVKPAEAQRSKEAEGIFSLPCSLAPLLLLILSGITAGLAFLSKAPALFLIPFTGLVLAVSAIQSCLVARQAVSRFLVSLLIWVFAAYLTFIAFWPAAWVEPVDRPLAVFENAFLSATDQEEAGEESYWLVPDLGPFYYLVNGGFKLSPLVMGGAGLAIFFWVRRRVGKPANGTRIDTQNETPFTPFSPPRLLVSPLLWLFIFVLLFTIFMTASDKRSPRYILPIFPLLAIIAAWGWLQLGSKVAGSRGAGEQGSRGAEKGVSRFMFYAPYLAFVIILIFSALVILLPYAPYYFTYFNPLLGGSYTAPHLVKIGWGEGLDQVGRFLQREGDARDSRVGTAYASTVAPYFDGDLSDVTGNQLDYVVLYSKQVQSGEPSPTFIRYFQQVGPIFSVNLNGLHYADVYSGPTLQSLTADRRPPTADALPIAFRSLTPYGHIGEPLQVEVVWQAGDPLPTSPANVTLAPIAVLDASQVVNKITILAEGQGVLTHTANDLVVSRHHLPLPADLARGPYALLLDGQPLGEIELRQFQIPANLDQVNGVIFGEQPTGNEQPSAVDGRRSSEQIALAAYQFEPTADFIGIKVAWQAQTSHLPDYTVFVQLLNAETHERLAGIDTPPQKGEWPTSRWVKGEVVVDEYLVAIPPGLSAGFYDIIVGLYRPETGQRLTLTNGQDHWTLPWTYIKK